MNFLFYLIVILLLSTGILGIPPTFEIYPTNAIEKLSSSSDGVKILENTENMNFDSEEVSPFEDELSLSSKTHFLKEITDNLVSEDKLSQRAITTTKGSNDYSIGDTLTIIAYNDPGGGDPLTMDVPATLRAAGEHCLIWVDNNDWGNPVTQEDVDHLVDVFDNHVFPTNVEYFGYPADVDGDGVYNVSILLLELSDYGTAGYYWSYAETENGFEIFFLDNDAGPDDIFYDSTMAHEFQHMIHGFWDIGEYSWIDEGCAVFAESLNSFLLANTDWTIPDFEDDPDTSLIFWDYDSVDHDVNINYAMSYLFITYLSENYGGSAAISALVQDGIFQGILAIEEIVLKPYGKTFEEVFIDWVMANYFDDPSFGNFGYSSLDVHTKHSDTIVLSDTNSSVTVSDAVDYWAADSYLLKDFSGTISISFNGVNNGDYNVSIAHYNHVQNTVSYMPLNSQEDGSLTLPMYDTAVLFVTNVKGDNSLGGEWEDQEGITSSSYSLTVTLDSTTVTLADATVTVDEVTHKLSVTNLTVSDQTTSWNAADLVGFEVIDDTGNPARLAYELTYNDQTSSWEGLNLDIESLPFGEYICRLFAVKGNEGGTIDSTSFSVLDSPYYWVNWLSDPDEGWDPTVELLNISTHITDDFFFVKLGLEAPPSLDPNHMYLFQVDLDTDDSSDWEAYWSYTYLESFWMRTADDWTAQSVHYTLGNNVIFKLPLREFLSAYEISIRAYAWDISSSADWNTGGYQSVYLYGDHSLSQLQITYPNEGVTIYGNITVTWIPAFDSRGHSINYTLLYSSNNGTTWTELVNDLNTTSYVWDTTTVAEGHNYLINVIATCPEGLTMNDTSNGVFSIQSTPHNVSIPTIIFPTGGETLTGNVMLEWTLINDSWEHEVTYTIWYSDDSGTSWIKLAAGLTATSYMWDTTTVTDGENYLIQVGATCTVNASLYQTAIIGTTFSIVNVASTSPSTSPSTSSSTSSSIQDTDTRDTSASPPAKTSSAGIIVTFLTIIFLFILIRRRKTI